MLSQPHKKKKTHLFSGQLYAAETLALAILKKCSCHCSEVEEDFFSSLLTGRRLKEFLMELTGQVKLQYSFSSVSLYQLLRLGELWDFPLARNYLLISKSRRYIAQILCPYLVQLQQPLFIDNNPSVSKGTVSSQKSRVCIRKTTKKVRLLHTQNFHCHKYGTKSQLFHVSGGKKNPSKNVKLLKSTAYKILDPNSN